MKLSKEERQLNKFFDYRNNVRILLIKRLREEKPKVKSGKTYSDIHPDVVKTKIIDRAIKIVKETL